MMSAATHPQLTGVAPGKGPQAAQRATNNPAHGWRLDVVGRGSLSV